MLKSTTGLAEKIIEGILELSADAQVARRRVAKDSPAFHTLTGVIATYGKVLELLAAEDPWEDAQAIFLQLNLPDPAEALPN